MQTIISIAGASKRILSKWVHLLDEEDITVIHQESNNEPWLLVRTDEHAAMFIGDKYKKYNVQDIHPANLQQLQQLHYRADGGSHNASVATFGMYAFIVEMEGVAMSQDDVECLARAVSRISGSNVDTIQVSVHEGELRITHGKHKIFYRSVDRSWWHLTDARKSSRESLYIDCIISMKGHA